jgi:hypothetical protein
MHAAGLLVKKGPKRRVWSKSPRSRIKVRRFNSFLHGNQSVSRRSPWQWTVVVVRSPPTGQLVGCLPIAVGRDCSRCVACVTCVQSAGPGASDSAGCSQIACCVLFHCSCSVLARACLPACRAGAPPCSLSFVLCDASTAQRGTTSGR